MAESSQETITQIPALDHDDEGPTTPIDNTVPPEATLPTSVDQKELVLVEHQEASAQPQQTLQTNIVPAEEQASTTPQEEVNKDVAEMDVASTTPQEDVNKDITVPSEATLHTSVDQKELVLVEDQEASSQPQHTLQTNIVTAEEQASTTPQEDVNMDVAETDVHVASTTLQEDVNKAVSETDVASTTPQDDVNKGVSETDVHVASTTSQEDVNKDVSLSEADVASTTPQEDVNKDVSEMDVASTTPQEDVNKDVSEMDVASTTPQDDVNKDVSETNIESTTSQEDVNKDVSLSEADVASTTPQEDVNKDVSEMDVASTTPQEDVNMDVSEMDVASTTPQDDVNKDVSETNIESTTSQEDVNKDVSEMDLAITTPQEDVKKAVSEMDVASTTSQGDVNKEVAETDVAGTTTQENMNKDVSKMDVASTTPQEDVNKDVSEADEVSTTSQEDVNKEVSEIDIHVANTTSQEDMNKDDSEMDVASTTPQEDENKGVSGTDVASTALQEDVNNEVSEMDAANTIQQEDVNKDVSENDIASTNALEDVNKDVSEMDVTSTTPQKNENKDVSEMNVHIASTTLQEDENKDVSETDVACTTQQEDEKANVASPHQIQEETPGESCNSHHQATNESVSTLSTTGDGKMHTDMKTTDTATCLNDTEPEAKCGIDSESGRSASDAIKLLGSEHSELLVQDETPSVQVHVHVPVEVGASVEEPTDLMEPENSREDSNSSQDVTKPKGDTPKSKDQPRVECVSSEQYHSNSEISMDETNQNWPKDKEEEYGCLPEDKVSSVPTANEDIPPAVINNNDVTNSSRQDFVKDDAMPTKACTTLDAATGASGRSTPNIEHLKDLTGRDSPSVRSVKEDSGRDSPSQRPRRRIGRDSVVTEANELNLGIFPAENLFEYQWPQEKGAEWYFVQEQISEFLQVKSFKRKYPDLERRVMDISEKDFLRERGVVTEEQVTLGLTALRADEVYDLMLKDAPDKSTEYARVLHEKEKQNISNKHKQYEAPSVDSSKVKEYVKKAVKQAADYNSALMAERREERMYYFDMQTLTVQMPASRMKKYDKEATKLGPYPVAVIPGQYQNYYRSYSSEELKYFPLNTSLYGPMAPRRQTDLAPPQARDEAELSSDNDTIPSTENCDSSSDASDHRHDNVTPMDISHDTMELVSDVTAANITLPTEQPPCVYKPMAVQDVEPSIVIGLERPKDIPDAICGLCLKDSSMNKMGVPEKMIHCSQCDNSGHPSCLDMTLSMVEVIQTYPWQCMECKTCFHCGDPTHEDKMMFCDMCDRGYHTFCVGLQDIPTGLWACYSCQTSDTPAALAPHVPSPPLPPTPPLAEPLPEEEPSLPQAESTPVSKKRGRRSATPTSASRQSTPGSKRGKASTPTPKRVRKK